MGVMCRVGGRGGGGLVIIDGWMVRMRRGGRI